MSEIDIHKYFHFMRDDYGTVYGIQEIGDVRELIKDIRKQNEQLKRLQAENERLKAEIDSCNDEFGCEEMAKLRKALEEIYKLSENAYCLTNGTNKDMAEFAKTIMVKISEIIGDKNNG